MQRETDNLDNAWTGAENPTAAPIELGCRIDGNWNEPTVSAHNAGRYHMAAAAPIALAKAMGYRA